MCVTKTKTNPKLPTSVAQCTQRAQSGNWLLALKRWTDNTNTKQLLSEWIGLAFQTHNCPPVLHSVVHTTVLLSGNSLLALKRWIDNNYTLCSIEQLLYEWISLAFQKRALRAACLLLFTMHWSSVRWLLHNKTRVSNAWQTTIAAINPTDRKSITTSQAATTITTQQQQ